MGAWSSKVQIQGQTVICGGLIDQVIKKAIPVFEEAHPGCKALYIFDQSSAHAALVPDALKAFEMNKSNGGEQRWKRKPSFRNSTHFQKMTMESGQQKGLQQTLKERGFNMGRLHAKCSPVCPFKNDDCCMSAFSVNKTTSPTKFLCSKV
jgi:hypothetical protein